MNNIEIINKRPVFNNNCIQCMTCASFCPKKAIEYKFTQEDIKSKNIDTSKVRIIKIMNLHRKRKRYQGNGEKT